MRERVKPSEMMTLIRLLPNFVCYNLEDEYGEDEGDDDLEEVDDERDEEVREGELARRDAGDPGAVEQPLVALHDDDHGRVAERHAVHDRQDDARRHEVRERQLLRPVDRLLEHQRDARDLLRDVARRHLGKKRKFSLLGFQATNFDQKIAPAAPKSAGMPRPASSAVYTRCAGW